MKKAIIVVIIISFILFVSCSKSDVMEQDKMLAIGEENGGVENMTERNPKDLNEYEIALEKNEDFINQSGSVEVKLDSVIKTETSIKEVDFSDSFNHINGGAIFYNEKENEYHIYNSDLCKKQVSPHSTFKIISTLMGLDKNIVDSKESTMGYDGTKYWNEEWNRNLNLKEAFQLSCVWFYRKIIDRLQEDYVQTILDEIEYGNKDISVWNQEGHNDFWLGSSLKISPEEQIKVLQKIFNGTTPFEKKDIDLLKEIMLVENIGAFNIYGKTGSAKTIHGWFVGFVEANDSRIYFAVKVEDDSLELAGGMAKTIALDIIYKKYISN